MRELIQDIKRHGMDRATTRELMLPAALRTDWLSPAQFEAMLDEEEWPDGEAD